MVIIAQKEFMRIHKCCGAPYYPRHLSQSHNIYFHLKPLSVQFSHGVGPVPDSWKRKCTRKSQKRYVTMQNAREVKPYSPSEFNFLGNPGPFHLSDDYHVFN